MTVEKCRKRSVLTTIENRLENRLENISFTTRLYLSRKNQIPRSVEDDGKFRRSVRRRNSGSGSVSSSSAGTSPQSVRDNGDVPIIEEIMSLSDVQVSDELVPEIPDQQEVTIGANDVNLIKNGRRAESKCENETRVTDNQLSKTEYTIESLSECVDGYQDEKSNSIDAVEFENGTKEDSNDDNVPNKRR